MRTLVLLCALSLSLVLSAQTKPSPCKAADALFTRLHIEAAREAYERVAAADTKAECATKGLAAVEAWMRAAKLHSDAVAFEDKKLLDEAREKWLEALKADPQYADAAFALARHGRSDKEDPYLEAQILSNLGMNKEALAAMKTAMKSGKEAPEDLEFLITETSTEWRRFKRWVLRYRWPIVEISSVSASLLLILGLAWTRFRGSPRIDVRDFNDTTAHARIGKNIAAMLRHHFTRLSTTHRPRLGTFTGPEEAVAALKDISANVPENFRWLNAVAAMLGRLSPRRTFTVDGDLLPAGEQGDGMTLVLTRGSRVIATATLWQKDFNPALKTAEKDPTGYYTLTEPAAVWLLYHVASEVNA